MDEELEREERILSKLFLVVGIFNIIIGLISLITKDSKPLRHFAIAGADKKFQWAKAKIKKDKIIARSKKIKNPVALRYAWADNPEGANLYNKEGLPASPFRTDQW